jgi:hypothetical protein
MGHVTVVADDIETARGLAEEVKGKIRVVAN